MKKDKDIEEEWNLIWSCRNGAYIINKQKLEMIRREIAKQAVQEYKKELGEKINGRQESRIPIHKSCPKAVKEKVLLKQDGYDLAIEEVKQIING